MPAFFNADGASGDPRFHKFLNSIAPNAEHSVGKRNPLGLLVCIRNAELSSDLSVGSADVKGDSLLDRFFESERLGGAVLGDADAVAIIVLIHQVMMEDVVHILALEREGALLCFWMRD